MILVTILLLLFEEKNSVEILDNIIDVKMFCIQAFKYIDNDEKSHDLKIVQLFM
jgi:hypothetical protein